MRIDTTLGVDSCAETIALLLQSVLKQNLRYGYTSIKWVGSLDVMVQSCRIAMSDQRISSIEIDQNDIVVYNHPQLIREIKILPGLFGRGGVGLPPGGSGRR